MGKDMRDLTKGELLERVGSSRRVSKKINKEWRRRYNINAPYMVTVDGNIKNCLIDAFVADVECDKVILGQANEIRKEMLRETEIRINGNVLFHK